MADSDYIYQEVGVLTHSSGGFIVASAIEGEFKPYARELGVSGNAVVYNDIQVSNAGILIAGTRTILSDCEVFSGGVLTATINTVLSGCVIHSGGVVSNSASTEKYFDLVLESGARLANVSANTTFGGDQTSIASGALCVGDGTIATDISASGGVIYNWKRWWGGRQMAAAQVYFSSGITLSNGTCDDQTIHIYSGAAVKDFTVSMAKAVVRGLVLYAGAAAIDLKVATDQTADGKVRFNDYNGENTLGGDKTNFAAGAVCYGDGTLTDTELYADQGKLYNLKVMNSRNAGETAGALEKLTLVSGISAVSATVGSGGTLTLRDGGVAAGATVSSAGLLYVDSNGVANDAQISSGGLGQVLSGGVASGARLIDTGRLNVNSGGFANGIMISGGTAFAYDGATINNTELVTGGALRVYAGANVSGAINANGCYIYVLDNAVAEDLSQTAGRIYVSGGATVTDMDMGGGFLYVAPGATMVDLYAHGGNTYFSDSPDAPVIQGKNTNINTNRLRYTSAASTALGLSVVDGVIYNLGSDGKLFRLSIGDDIVVSEGAVGNDCRISAFGNAMLKSVQVTGTTADAGVVLVGEATAYDTVLNGNGKAATLTVSGNATAYRTVVNSGAYISVLNGGTDRDAVVSSGGILHAGSGGSVDGARVITDGRLNVSSGAFVGNAKISGGLVYAYDGGTVGNLELVTGGTLRIYAGATISGVSMTAGNIRVLADAAVDGISQNNGRSYIESGAVITGMRMNGGSACISGGATLVDYTATGGNTYFHEDVNNPLLQGRHTNINTNRLRYTSDATTALGLSVVNGEVRNLGSDGKAFALGAGDDIFVSGASLGDGQRLRLFGSATVESARVTAGTKTGSRGSLFATGNARIFDAVASGSAENNRALINLWGNASAQRTVVDRCGTLALLADGAVASDTLVRSGGYLVFSAATGAGTIENTTVLAGGTMTLNGNAHTGEKLTLDFGGSTTAMLVNDLGYINGSTTVYVKGVEQLGTYTLGQTGTLSGDAKWKWGLYEDDLSAAVYDPLNERKYELDGADLTTTALAITSGTASALTSANKIAGTDIYATKWTGATNVQDILVTTALDGDAYVTLDGDFSTAAVFGAGVLNFGHEVNLYAKNGTIANLAGGAKKGGTVNAVNLTFEDGAKVNGLTLAGGQGNVTGAVRTLVSGGTFGSSFVAGTYSNKVKTTVGSVELTIDGGTFRNNVFGGTQVKYTNADTSTVGSITVNLNDVDSVNYGFSLYAGGIAAGSSKAKTAYEVGSVTVNVTGGNWSKNAPMGGHGIFGGIFTGDTGASGNTGVKAAVTGQVAINISGDTTVLGNVYGGGWSQRGAESSVGSVAITVAGGTVANIFGGGIHSNAYDGNTTSVDGDVSITVKGGSVTNNIYARGQASGDYVYGVSTVKFEGRGSHSCNVYGYDYVGAGTTPGDSTNSKLMFDGFYGSITGSIAGFDKITFAGAAEAALGEVENIDWEFDLSARNAAYAGYAMLNWAGSMSSGTTVSLRLASDASASDSWIIADGLSGAATNYELYLDDAAAKFTTATLDTAISGTGTAYDGWKLTFADSTLKFAKVTA